MLALPQPSTRSLQHIYQVQLGRFLGDSDFMPEVKDALFSFVSASIAIYYRMCGSMRPTPAKIHYTFNIRDLSKVTHKVISNAAIRCCGPLESLHRVVNHVRGHCIKTKSCVMRENNRGTYYTGLRLGLSLRLCPVSQPVMCWV